MLVLGIETSGLEGSIALLRDQSCLGERELNQSGRRHAQSLVLEIGNLLKNQGLGPRDIELVAVSRGPGSFTGLRVGMVCAKTIAYATGCRFIAIDTFAAIAENLPPEIMSVFVIEDAQREDLFVGEYRRTDSTAWEQVTPIQIVSVASFLNRRRDAEYVTGPGGKKLKVPNGDFHVISADRICQPKARIVAEIGRRRMIETGIDSATADSDFWKASPFYIRLSAAEEKRSLAERSASSPIS